MEIGNNRNLKKWKNANSEICKFGEMQIWKNENLEKWK